MLRRPTVGGRLGVKQGLWVGGVPPHDWRDAPSRKEVVHVLARKIDGCILVGHGLGSDLNKLSLRHPKCAAVACSDGGAPPRVHVPFRSGCTEERRSGSVTTTHGKDRASVCREMQADLVSYKKFHGRGGQSPALKDLAKRYLDRAIQTGRHSARCVPACQCVLLH